MCTVHARYIPLTEVCGLVARLAEVGGEGPLLVGGHPVGGGAVVVVCEHLVGKGRRRFVNYKMVVNYIMAVIQSDCNMVSDI